MCGRPNLTYKRKIILIRSLLVKHGKPHQESRGAKHKRELSGHVKSNHTRQVEWVMEVEIKKSSDGLYEGGYEAINSISASMSA